MVITNCFAVFSGGGIHTEAAITIAPCTGVQIFNNAATSFGGAFTAFAGSNLLFTQSEFSDNVSGFYGGGILALYGNATVTYSKINRNRYGKLRNAKFCCLYACPRKPVQEKSSYVSQLCRYVCARRLSAASSSDKRCKHWHKSVVAYDGGTIPVAFILAVNKKLQRFPDVQFERPAGPHTEGVPQRPWLGLCSLTTARLQTIRQMRALAQRLLGLRAITRSWALATRSSPETPQPCREPDSIWALQTRRRLQT